MRYCIRREDLPIKDFLVAQAQKNPQRPEFLKKIIALARAKRIPNEEIIAAYNEIPTLKMVPQLVASLGEKEKLSLSEAFALLMKSCSTAEVEKYRLSLYKMI